MIKTDENGKELKLFKIGDLFSIFPTKAYKISDSEIIGGDGEYYPTPFITTTESNNGLKGISGLKPNNPGNVITFSDTTGTDSIFYQSKPYIGRSHVQEMQVKNGKFDRKIALYVISSIKKSVKGIYSYGFKMNRQRVSATEIYLPINDNGDPDWDYMSDYISNIERDYVDSVKSFNDRELRILDTIYADTEAPGEPYEYKEFRIGDVFNVSTGSYCPGLEKGEVARISTKSTNNGILGYFDSSNYNGSRHEENCITVNFFGSDGGVFYHKNEVSLDLKVHALKPKDHDLNKEIALYLCSSLIKTLSGYSYANQLSSSKLKKDDIFITLPSTPDGSIDWDYMEQYVSYIAGGGRRRIDKWITSRNREY